MTAALSAKSNGTQAALLVNGVEAVVFEADGIVSGVKKSAVSQMPVLGTAVATTSGTAFDFTGIPSWANEIDVLFNLISTNGAGNGALLVQVGSGSIQTTGYVSYAGVYTNANQTGTTNSTAGLVATLSMGATSTHTGILSLKRISGNTWVSAGSGGGLDGAGSNTARNSGGTVTLGGALDRLRFTTTNGTDVFDAGSVNIIYR